MQVATRSRGKEPARAQYLPGWISLEGHPRDYPRLGQVLEELNGEKCLEYTVGRGDERQGRAVLSLAKGGPVTKQGAWLDGFHVVASDKDFDDFMSGGTDEMGVKQRFHLCSRIPCKQTQGELSQEVVHIDEWRVVTGSQALRISYATSRVKEFLAALSEAEKAAERVPTWRSMSRTSR